MANLYEVIMGLIEKGKQKDGKSADQLYQPGQVVSVNADGTYDVSVGGATMRANPETDFPLRPGQTVYVSPVRNGPPVVHGPR